MIYLIIANVAIALSFSLYHLFFRKLTFFQWNRFYLLGAVLVSLLIPVGLFINLSAYFVQETTIPTIHLAEIMDISVISFSPEAIPYRLMDVLIPVYWTGVLLSLGYLLYRLLQLRKLFSREEDYLSFSFFRRVFMGQKVQQHETILTHEQVHVQQGHSYDIVFMELVKAFNWFNPTLYFMLKEVKFQHECIADEVCSEDKVAYAELLVANALRVEQSALVHEFSNQSFLKKRIMMLFKNKSSHRQKLFYLSVLPVLLILTGSTLLFNTTKAKEIVSNVENRIQDVALPVKKQFVVDLEASDQKGSVQQELADTHDERVLGVAIPVLSVIAEPDTIKGIVKYINNAPQFHSDGRGDNILFTSVEINPSPKGGMDAFRKWIAENCRYPVAAINAEAKGTVTISFVVEEDGKLSDIKTLKDIGYGTGDAVVRLMEKAELWNPGIQNGRAVRTAYTLPIRLDLS
ncbi:MAG TPA: M56 family metallopeptidase, partial [Sphingobacterium sp.]|nr:M56 family metallopeptidase [Sphingobacterium sp.]